MKAMRQFRVNAALFLFISFTLPVEMVQAQDQRRARQILDATGVKGGLIIHVGCGDGKLTAALAAGDEYLVQGLDTDKERVERAREFIQSQGTYGKVSADRFDGCRLPYVDNLVNLVVAEDLDTLDMKEIMRVLCPRGAAYVRKDGKWQKHVKAWPREIDEWAHYL
jgi:ubiquinone/menaquinone biosynthesis C-methylase UbiE